MKNDICTKSKNLQKWFEEYEKGSLGSDAKKHIALCPSCKSDFEGLIRLNKSLDKKFQIKQNTIPQNASDTIFKYINETRPSTYDNNKNLSFFSKLFSLVTNNWHYTAFAISIILVSLIFMYSTNSPENQLTKISGKPQFNLLACKPSIIVGDNSLLLENNKVTTLTNKSKLSKSVKYTLVSKSILRLAMNNTDITFKDKASFTITDKTITLSEGSIHCNLKGSHKGFYLKTPFAKITPLGTNFKVEIKPWGGKVILTTGKISIVNNYEQEKIINNHGNCYVLNTGEFHTKFPKSQPVSPTLNTTNNKTTSINKTKSSDTTNLMKSF